jgi:molybdate transport system substrate-binding protein
MCRALAIWLTLVAACSPPVRAQDLAVAAAADLQTVLPLIVTRFEHETGRRLRVTYGSSGLFYAQIKNGAPFDVLCSADIDYPRRLVADRLADGASLREYAEGRLVLWSRSGSGIDVSRGLAVLTEAKVRRVAIANPAHAPYGRAAVAALTRARLYEALQEKLVFGENVAQTAQFAQSGNAEAGLFALSLALGPTLRASGTHFLVPPDSYPAITQAAVALRASRNKPLAEQFVAFLTRADSVADLRAFGFFVR